MWATILTILLLLTPQQAVQEFAEIQAERIVNDWSHSTDLDSLMGPGLCEGVGERIGTGPSLERIERAWRESPSHAIIPTAQPWDYRYTAVYTVGEQLYVVDIWCVYWKEDNEIHNNTTSREIQARDRSIESVPLRLTGGSPGRSRFCWPD